MQTDAEVYHIYFDQELNSVVMKWDGYATTSQFRQGTEMMLDILKQHKASKVLADIKKMVLIGGEDQQWLLNDFLPRAAAFGFSTIALVNPENYFNKVAVESICQKVDPKELLVRIFDHLEEAKRWLHII